VPQTVAGGRVGDMCVGVLVVEWSEWVVERDRGGVGYGVGVGGESKSVQL
jgi:hypothetical protein